MYNRLIDASVGLFSGIFLAEVAQKAGWKGLKPEEAQQQMEKLLAETSATREVYNGYLENWLHIMSNPQALEPAVKDLDAWAQLPALAMYREYLFDLLYVAWLSRQEEAGNTDWMDSPEWQRLEDKLAERGTEMLTLLMYLQEVVDSDIKANLDDFLEQFISDEEMDFQDDLEVYEEVIANRDYLELTFEEMVQAAEKVAPETAIPEVFTPLFCFFKSPEKAQINLFATLCAGGEVNRNLPVVMAMLLFYKGKGSISANFLLAHA